MPIPTFKFKNLTRTDLLQYDGENFVNVPVYTIKTRVEWAFNDINSAILKITNDNYLVSIPGHKHIIDDVEGLREALNNTGSNVDIDLSNYVTILPFNNHINNNTTNINSYINLKIPLYY